MFFTWDMHSIILYEAIIPEVFDNPDSNPTYALNGGLLLMSR